jgi:hypothetical protein
MRQWMRDELIKILKYAHEMKEDIEIANQD